MPANGFSDQFTWLNGGYLCAKHEPKVLALLEKKKGSDTISLMMYRKNGVKPGRVGKRLYRLPTGNRRNRWASKKTLAHLLGSR